ncbi:GIY-YIG nuclease family protein [Candidatus Parcubacteria bacterium]|nr:GIY-YIG nuclease family protein [Candidatus Parcubacteria bacterium]
MYYTYVLRSITSGRWYTGSTEDLRERFKQHNASSKRRYTKGRGLYELIYYEACRNRQDASAREKYLKSTIGKRYLRNRLKRSLSLTG